MERGDVEQQPEKAKRTRPSSSRKKRAVSESVVRVSNRTPSPCLTVHDAMAAISDGDAHSLASFFRGLISPIAVRNGPQHVCLKRAFNLMDSRWDVNAKSGQKEPPLAFGTSSVLPPELFAHVVDFLDGNEAMRITLTGKAWWRTISTLPPASHLDLCKVTGCGMGWLDLLKHLRHIKQTNPRRAVTRLTLNGTIKLGSLSNLSSAAGGLLTHIDFSRARSPGSVNFDQVAVNIPGLKGLAVQETFYGSQQIRGWVRSLAKLTRAVSLESLRVSAVQYQYGSSSGSDRAGENGWGRSYTCLLDNASLAAFAQAGEFLRHLWIIAGSKNGTDVEEGIAVLGVAAPRLEVLTTDELKVTDKGWADFAAARLAMKRPLVSIRIRAVGATHVPSRTTRAALLDAVTESLLLFAALEIRGDSTAGADAPRLPPLDCEGDPVVCPEGSDGGTPQGKLRVTDGGPWRWTWSLNARDL